nr:unnamed protein product [Spirometra erinaceieuropaei]
MWKMATWMRCRSRCWQLLDYDLFRMRGRQSVLVNKTICDFDGWTSHRLVISKMGLRLQVRRGPQANPATATITVTNNHTVTAPPPLITDITHPVQTPASITAASSANNTISLTLHTDETTPNVLSSAIIAINTHTSCVVDSDRICPDCNRTFTSYIDLFGYLRVHPTGNGKPVPGAPAYTRRIYLHYPHIFIHRIGLFGHMRLHESGHSRSIDTSFTLTIPSPINVPSPSTPPTSTSTTTLTN